jgi:tetratricopeptide (TPR) repeat protein
MQAYERYLQGRHLFNRRAGSDLPRARADFEEAVRIDPGYARAWAALAGVYFVAYFEDPELSDRSKWQEAAQRAVTLEPDLAEANIRAAQYYWLAGDSAAADMHMDRAIALDPADPLVVSVSISQAVIEGRMEEAVALQRRLAASDPVSTTARTNLAVLLMMTGDLDEAQAELERALELSQTSANMMLNVAYLLILQRRTDEALKAIQQIPAGYRRDMLLALAYYTRGDVAESDAMLARLLAQGEAPGRDLEMAVSVAEVYAARNDFDRAFQWLDIARQDAKSKDPLLAGKKLRSTLQMAPFLKPMHTDPRWKELLAAIDAQ